MFREIEEIKPDETRKAYTMSIEQLSRRIQPKKEMDKETDKKVNIFRRIKVEEEAQK